MAHLRAFLLALVPFIAFALLASTAAGGPSAPPFAPGTTWTYQRTIIKPDGQSRTGTSRDVYHGQTTYRGQAYHVVEQSSSLVPGFVERTYVVWTGSHFRQAAIVATDAQNNVAEIILDRPFGLAVAESVSGVAQVVVNGAQPVAVPWSFIASSRGTERVTVPAGALRTTKWEAVLRLGQLESHFTIHVVGIVTDVRMESKEYLSGSLTVTTSRELMSGPVR